MEPEQRTEMVVEMRRLRQAGVPEKASKIQEALSEDRFFLGGKTPLAETVVTPKKSASVEAWRKYALSVSDIDPKVIEKLPRNDVRKMLEANGLVG